MLPGMSKAFTKDDAPVETVRPPRAPLPEGVVNYVTPRGLDALASERTALRAELARVDPAGPAVDRGPMLADLQSRLAELEGRIASAVVVDPRTFAHDRIRLGAWVTVEGADGGIRRLKIVGVDEADAGAGLIAFVSPVGRALLGKGVGDHVTVRAPRGNETLEVQAIEYAEVAPVRTP